MSSNTIRLVNIGQIVVRNDEGFWILPEFYARKNEYVINSPWFLYLGEKWRLVMSTGYDGNTRVYLWRKFDSDLPECEYKVELAIGGFYDRNCESSYRAGKLDIEYGYEATFDYKRYAYEGQYGLIKICFSITAKSNAVTVSSANGKENEKEVNSDDEDNGKKNTLCEDKGIKMLAENLKQVLIDERMTDAVLKVDNRQFKVHKIILIARSPVFASMFEHDMTEKKDNAVDIPDCTAESFEVFLHYIYSGSVETLSASNVYNVYYAADKYRVDDLKEKCVKFMIKNISVETFCDVIDLSLRHAESKLQKVATDFFCKNMKKIIKTVQWQKYLDENSTQANELLIKAINA